MAQDETIRFEYVRPIDDDLKLIMDWNNDPETLAMSFHGNKKEWSRFSKEFLNKNYSFPELPPLFIWVGGERTAFVQFKPVAHQLEFERKWCEISINVAPYYRGKGIGTKILKELQSWVAQQGYDDIYAQVKSENTASRQAFLAAGFQSIGDIEFIIPDTEERVRICRFVVSVTPHKNEKKVFIIAEAGSNWHASPLEEGKKRALKMIEIAKEAGADAIKFQIFKPETIYVPNAGMSDYLAEAGIKRSIRDIFEELSMPYEFIPELASFATKMGLQFMASPFSVQDFEAVNPYVTTHKIASYEITHLRLIEKIARTGKPIFLSTGASLEHEIAWALDLIKLNGGGPVTLLQCTAKYPAPPSSMHLRVLPWLKHRFRTDVGLSDHSLDPTAAPVSAVALGAKVIEKHFTLNKQFTGPDHQFALNPDELKRMVDAVRIAEQMPGSDVKIIDPCENELHDYSKRGLQALRDIKPGELLQEGRNYDILRPGKQVLGLHPRYVKEIEGKPAKRAIPLGSGLQRGDW